MTTPDTSIAEDVVLTMSLIGQQGKDDGLLNHVSFLRFRDDEKHQIEIQGNKFELPEGIPVQQHSFTGTDKEIIQQVLRHTISILAGTRTQNATDSDAQIKLTEQLMSEYFPK